MRRFLIILLLGICLAECEEERPLTISEVLEGASELDGQQIRVRGQSRFQLLPRNPMQIGGCSPVESANNAPITSELMLVDENNESQTLLISENSVQCAGDTCRVTCSPFVPSTNINWGTEEKITAFELVGTLHVQEQDGRTTLTLDNLDLPASSRFNEGVWESIPTGEFEFIFP